MWTTILLIIAIVLFAIAAIPLVATRVNLIAIGLACFAAAFVVQRL